MDMSMLLGGVILPKGGTYKKVLEENKTTTITLGGTRYTDFKNNMRKWEIHWDVIKYTDYLTIYNLYKRQYENNAYEVFRFDAESISVPAELEISDVNIALNAAVVHDFTITISEQYAFS